jgi:hypothetical protein
MGAIALTTSVSLKAWTDYKPKDYKNSDLDKALAAWDALYKKAVPAVVKPNVPSIKGYEAALKAGEGIVKHIKEAVAQLDKISASAKKTAADLGKLSAKLKGDKLHEYKNAIKTADALVSNAAFEKRTIG